MPTTHDAQGVLAIWNDVPEGREAEFESWYKNEHLPERLAVPGFRLGRRFEAVSGAPRYFCYYLTDSPDVLTSAPYIERLNHPTTWTRSIMMGGFVNMNRTVCRRAQRHGALFGSIAVTVRLGKPPTQVPALDGLAGADGVARCELWTAVDTGGGVAAEEALRGRDARIAACVMVETLRPSDAERVHGRLEREFDGVAEIGVYRLLCELESSG
jgi:hypothetical protein